MKTKVRKGDHVQVISGPAEDKGKRGEVVKVAPDDEQVVVQGVNLQTKHQRQVQAQGRTVTPGKVRFEGPIHLSNVMLVCPHCKNPTRVHLKREGDKLQRFCKNKGCGGLLDE